MSALMSGVAVCAAQLAARQGVQAGVVWSVPDCGNAYM